MTINVAVFDLDGCLSDDRWRQEYLPVVGGENPGHLTDQDYYDYNRLCGEDGPYSTGIEVLRAHVTGGDFIVFCTARPEKFRGETTAWIYEFAPFLPPSGMVILMRPTGNHERSPQLKIGLLRDWLELSAQPAPAFNVAVAYDDREDVLAAYRKEGIHAIRLAPGEKMQRVSTEEKAALLQSPPPPPRTAADVLQDAANTFRERNAVYKDNYKQVAQLVKIFFPGGVPPELVVRDQWHLFELMLVKLSRFAISGLQHQDSIRDTAVYAAMIEAIIEEQGA